MDIITTLATQLNVRPAQVQAAVTLLDEGATVPFIARYRKEVTGELTDTHLRDLQEQLIYLRELEERRTVILTAIESQGKLSDELKQQLLSADSKARLEDLYAPYKQKRRTKAQIAREAGLEPLAEALLNDPTLMPETIALNYLNADHAILTAAEALEGARHILMERFAEHADLVATLRETVLSTAFLQTKVQKDKEEIGAKFKDYFDFQEALHKIPAHRALAIFRGEKEEILRSALVFSTEAEEESCVYRIAQTFGIAQQKRAADAWLWQTAEWTWKVKLKLKIDLDLLTSLREYAETQAIHVFQDNLKHLLMSAPAGKKVTLGLDPGLRTGVKTVVVDDTGKLLANGVIYPHVPKQEWDRSLHTLAQLCEQYHVSLVAIGNGTASRETEKLVGELIKTHSQLNLTSVVVSEAGASVYSASEFAAKEFPDLDVSFRGAVSIARRLQDPLAELVKIDPKSIGVGQYQHDVNQVKLTRGLEAVLEDCVNAVGADVNTASVPLLRSIAGLNETIAQNIIQYREAHGRFKSREELKKVPRLGEKTYQQAVGFLRIIEGDNPLDASAVHPESYPLVDQVLARCRLTVKELMGNVSVINTLNAKDFANDQYGAVTVADIFAELKKPGRDPRPEFKTAKFKEGVNTLEDLKPGMRLEGAITNVTNFGAFVDIGVHQDGLVHISHLSDHFVKDPNLVVSVGQIVQVKVLEVDLARKRVQLSMKSDSAHSTAGAARPQERAVKPTESKPPRVAPVVSKAATGSLGDLLKDALKSKK